MLVILLLVATGVSTALWAFERDAALPYEASRLDFCLAVANAVLWLSEGSKSLLRKTRTSE